MSRIFYSASFLLQFFSSSLELVYFGCGQFSTLSKYGPLVLLLWAVSWDLSLTFFQFLFIPLLYFGLSCYQSLPTIEVELVKRIQHCSLPHYCFIILLHYFTPSTVQWTWMKGPLYAQEGSANKWPKSAFFTTFFLGKFHYFKIIQYSGCGWKTLSSNSTSNQWLSWRSPHSLFLHYDNSS